MAVQGLSLVAVLGRLVAAASVVAEYRLSGVQASMVVVRRLSCSAACRIFPDTGWSLCVPSHWQVDS